jgi:chromosomal replication initiation ATPase DnaA
MENIKELKQKIDIQKFREKFSKKYGVNISVFVNTRKSFKMDLEILAECTLNAIHINQPEYKSIECLSYKTRKREFLSYVQAMSYMAHKERYTLTKIGSKINRDHSTILNSIKQVDNAFFTRNMMIINAYNNILKEIKAYVGNIPENLKKQVDTKSSLSAIWNEAKNGNTIKN